MRFFARFIELIPSIEYLSMGDIVEEFAKVSVVLNVSHGDE